MDGGKRKPSGGIWCRWTKTGVVLEVNGKHLLVPKARVDALVEVE
jgi:hypothetical protein